MVPPKLIGCLGTSGGELMQKTVTDAFVVKAFNSVGNAHFYNPQFTGGPPDMFICGEDAKAKEQVSRICKDFGWNSIDVGGIGFPHYLEAAAMIWIITAFADIGIRHSSCCECERRKLRMKILLSICAAVLMVGFGALSGHAQSGNSDRDHLIGAWRLVELDQPGPDGTLNRIDSSGMFVFTRDGHLSVQVMDRVPKQQVTPAGPEQYSQGGYEASYGSYTVDEQAHTFIFHVEGALVRSLIGKDLLRAFEISGNRMIVKSARPDEHWRVVWERYPNPESK